MVINVSINGDLRYINISGNTIKTSTIKILFSLKCHNTPYSPIEIGFNPEKIDDFGLIR